MRPTAAGFEGKVAIVTGGACVLLSNDASFITGGYCPVDGYTAV